MKSIAGCLGLLMLFAACSDNDSNDLPISGLSGKTFQMVVDRIVTSPDVMLPVNEMDESAYSLYTGEKVYTVAFADDGKTVTVEPGGMMGEKTIATAGYVKYELHSGVFAGGRFVVWNDKGYTNAELTIYGSGVPIVSSERGTLIPK